jgi:IclR family pca regulon transcriptional regulator
MDEDQCLSLLSKMNFVPHTPYTITEEAVLLEDLRLTRQRGYSIADQELTLGMKSMAVPIFDKKGVVEASFGVSYPSHRQRDESLEPLLIEKLLEIAKKVSCF